MLETCDAYNVVAQVFNGAEVLPAIEKYQPQLLLLDVAMPGSDGFEVACSLRQHHRELKVIFISMYSDALLVEKAKALGVQGYLLKTASRDELLACVNLVLAGGESFFKNKISPNASELEETYAKKYKLTSREKEVIGYIKKGYSSQQIANAVFLSVFTVETHRRNINLKLGVKNVAELLRKAEEIGL